MSLMDNCTLNCNTHIVHLHIGQGDLGDRGQCAQGAQGVLSEVGHGAQVCVQQTPRDLQRELPCLTEPLQDPEPTFAQRHTGQLQLHPAASHTLGVAAQRV